MSKQAAGEVVAAAALPSGKTTDVFLSYARADRDRVGFIVEALQREGFSVWWDRKIPAGQNFSRVIKERLDAAKCVVVIWSKDSVQSTWVEAEASRANKRGVLIPALIDAVEDDVPLEFSPIQAAQLQATGDVLQDELKALADSVRELTR